MLKDGICDISCLWQKVVFGMKNTVSTSSEHVAFARLSRAVKRAARMRVAGQRVVVLPFDRSF